MIRDGECAIADARDADTMLVGAEKTQRKRLS